ncbi:MAG: hypothetical protein LBV06_09685 [Propionibacteriaceae bacterium]|jgi:hypothetical protein|nr:hypothetical protein [Propionibacteriaceae bacterium]
MESPQASDWTPVDPPLPLARYALALDGPAQDPADRASRQQVFGANENDIARCMAQRGFRYEPRPYVPGEDSNAGLRLTRLLTDLPIPLLSPDRDVVARFGYGLREAPDARDLIENAQDANASHQAGLSAAEADAYSRALYGDYDAADPKTDQSCAGQAQARHPQPEPPTREWDGTRPSTDIPVEEKSLLGTAPEREVALADFDCRAETDYLAQLTDIRVSLDEKFIREHHAELDRLEVLAATW